MMWGGSNFQVMSGRELVYREFDQKADLFGHRCRC